MNGCSLIMVEVCAVSNIWVSVIRGPIVGIRGRRAAPDEVKRRKKKSFDTLLVPI